MGRRRICGDAAGSRCLERERSSTFVFVRQPPSRADDDSVDGNVGRHIPVRKRSSYRRRHVPQALRRPIAGTMRIRECGMTDTREFAVASRPSRRWQGCSACSGRSGRRPPRQRPTSALEPAQRPWPPQSPPRADTNAIFGGACQASATKLTGTPAARFGRRPARRASPATPQPTRRPRGERPRPSGSACPPVKPLTMEAAALSTTTTRPPKRFLDSGRCRSGLVAIGVDRVSSARTPPTLRTDRAQRKNPSQPTDAGSIDPLQPRSHSSVPLANPSPRGVGNAPTTPT